MKNTSWMIKNAALQKMSGLVVLLYKFKEYIQIHKLNPINFLL